MKNNLLSKFFEPISDKGVRPKNSLKVSKKGELLGFVSLPSLKPLLGSLINANVMTANTITGKPTAINATCHPLRPKGASVVSGYQPFHVSKIDPPKKEKEPLKKAATK